MTVSLNQIRQIAIPVHDLEFSVAFYRDALGMKFLFEAPPQLAFFDCGGIRIMLDVPEGEQFGNHSSVIYFKVDDIQATFKELVEKGVKTVGEPHMIAKMPDHDLWLSEFRDPDDNILALMCEVPN